MADAPRKPARRKPLGDVEVPSEPTLAADGQQTPGDDRRDDGSRPHDAPSPEGSARDALRTAHNFWNL